MAERSGSAQFQALLESALRTYEKSAGVTLAELEHPLAVQLQSCHSVDDMTALLQDQAQIVDDSRQRDRIVKSIKATVSILIPISSGVSGADNVGLTFAPGKTLTAVLGISLDAASGVITSYGTLADLLESIEHFVNCLKIYAQTKPMHAIDEIVIKLMMELITTLVLMTEKLKKRRSLQWVKNFFGVKEINAARQRLDHVMKEGSQTVTALTPGLVDGVAKDVMKFVDEGSASADDVREVSDRMTLDVNGSKRFPQGYIGGWLSPPDPWRNYNIGRGFHHSGTGEWFVNGITFSEWKASEPGSLLWINGKPGTGKSVLCSRIIDEIRTLRNSGFATLAMFYYDFREDDKKDLYGLLSSVLFQLCSESDAYYDTLSTFYSTHRNGEQRPSNDELVRCLTDLLKLPGSRPVYLIIDALDECPSTSSLSSPRENVLSLLEDLVDAQLPNLRICVTSGPEIDIKAILEPLAFRSVSLNDASGQQEDIKNYIRSTINTNKNMKNWNSEHKQLAIDVLTGKADGMFCWAHCQIKYLAGCQPDRIRDVLDELPATLDGIYERTLREIEETDWKFARRLLLCVAAASRRLRVDELAEILAFDIEAGPIPKFREDWHLKNPVEALLSTCSTMLSVLNVRKTKVVQLAHFSAIEFLTSTRFADKRDNTSRRYHISMTTAHTTIAQTCLGALLHLDKDVTRDSLTQFPFAIYAAEHWFKHARFEGVSKNVDEGMKQLFDRTKPHLSIWIGIRDPTTPEQQYERVERPFLPHGTPLHYAAFCGLPDIVKVLAIEHPQDVNSRRFEDEVAPLHLASHVGVAQLLVEHGADAEVRNNDGRTPLHLASLNGQLDLARMLVEHSAELAAQDNDGCTPLHLASQYGHVGLARMLMKYGADVIAQDYDRRTPLHLALANEHVDLARILIEHGADVAAKDKDAGTPLHLASLNGHMGLARMLVEHGADASAQGKDGSAPLHLASDKNHEVLARMLVENGADIVAQDKDGRTPLHLATEHGHEDLAWMLVGHGADVAAQDSGGSSPLHLASCRGYFGLAQMLVEHGADMAAQDEAGRTSLHWALVCRGSVRIAQMLVEHGADGKIQDNAGDTSLHLASYNGHIDVARMLVEQGADLAAQNVYGSTPLHWASLKGYGGLARMLVGHGADVVARDKSGNTPLHCASELGHVKVVRMLVEHGADAAAQDEEGNTPLHLVSHKGFVDIAQMLVEHGVDVTVQNKDGVTPLHQASVYDQMDLARMLIAHGADVAVQDNDGRTPLHWALDRGCVDCVQMLVEHGANSESAVQGALPIEHSTT